MKPIELVNKQVEMERLWFEPQTITEAFLIYALRHLHAVIEGDDKAAKFFETKYRGVE